MVLEFERNGSTDFLWKKYVDDEGCLTGVAAVAVETAGVVALNAMATIVAVAEVQLGVTVSARWRQQ